MKFYETFVHARTYHKSCTPNAVEAPEPISPMQEEISEAELFTKAYDAFNQDQRAYEVGYYDPPHVLNNTPPHYTTEVPYRFTVSTEVSAGHLPVIDWDIKIKNETLCSKDTQWVKRVQQKETRELLQKRLHMMYGALDIIEAKYAWKLFSSSNSGFWAIIDNAVSDCTIATKAAEDIGFIIGPGYQAILDIRYMRYAAKRNMFCLRAIPKVRTPLPKLFSQSTRQGSDEFEQWCQDFESHWKKDEISLLSFHMSL